MKGLEEPISEKTWSDCIMKYIAIVKSLVRTIPDLYYYWVSNKRLTAC